MLRIAVSPCARWLGSIGSVDALIFAMAGHTLALQAIALKDTGGRVAGPTGAAVKLGMPRSTMESKIRSLKINKNRFKTWRV